MTSYFFSDIHLKSSVKSLDDQSSRLLLLFLTKIWPKQPGDLFLLGDIFDVWVSSHSIFINQHRGLIEELKKIKRLGYQVIYFEGNHDLHLKAFWHDELGFTVCHDVAYFEIEGRIFRLEHGDLINKEDHAYLKLRQRLRSPTMSFLARWLPGHVWKKVGEAWSQKSRKNSQAYLQAKNYEVVKMVRRHAQTSWLDKPFDFIITGHMHVVDDFQFEVPVLGATKKIRSINLGTWLDGAKILKFSDNDFIWIKASDLEQ